MHICHGGGGGGGAAIFLQMMAYCCFFCVGLNRVPIFTIFMVSMKALERLKGIRHYTVTLHFRAGCLCLAMPICLISVSVLDLGSLGKWSCLDRDMKKFWI